MTPGDAIVREVGPADLPDLVALKGSAAVHLDRLAETIAGQVQYLGVALDGRVVGTALLVIETPATWPRRLVCPRVVDLYVAPEHRSRGLGTALLREAERRAAALGWTTLRLAVDPLQNRRALALYRRLGYEPEPAEAEPRPWRHVAADGQVHDGRDWNLELRKSLPAGGEGR